MPSATESSVFSETRLSPESLERLSNRCEPAEDGSSMSVRTPISDDEIGTVQRCVTADVERAAERARTAQHDWEATSIEDRAAILERFGDLVVDHRPELLDIMQLETGKSRMHALEEALDVPQTCTYYASTAASALADQERDTTIPFVTDATVTYDPVGVVGVISPWNYPMTLALSDAIPALLAGNTVVCKPDERTPYTALALATLLDEAGLPDGCFEIVTGDGATVGPALVDSVDYIAFTGSTETGRTVAEQAGRNLIGCSLELGGKNPMVVLDDADVQSAAYGAAKGAFTNTGQLCLAPERILVHEDRYDAFLDAFVGATRQLTVGLSFGFGPDVGSLIDGSHRDTVSEYVRDAVDDGAAVLSGGRERPDIGPFCYEPTILTDVSPDSRLACEETFGPVVSVTPVTDTGAAIERANDTEYGLNASVWTGDRSRGQSVAREIDCGTVCVNDPYAVGWSAFDAPMGGFADSGLGRRHGPEGIVRFTESRTVATSHVGTFDAPTYVPNRLAAAVTTTLADSYRQLLRWFR